MAQNARSLMLILLESFTVTSIQLTKILKFSVSTTPNPHLLGGSKCTYGPSYWCSHVDNAKDCDVSK